MADIDSLKKKLAYQKSLKEDLKKEKKDRFIPKVDKKIKELEAQIKEAGKPKSKPAKAPAKAKKTPAKKAKSKVAGMSRERCIEELEQLKLRVLKAEKNKEKNIKSGKAYADGSLKPGASLENEAEVIENKAGAGHSIPKKEQKQITINIEEIVRNVVQMIKTKKDSEVLLQDLIKRLNQVLSDVKRRRVYYEG